MRLASKFRRFFHRFKKPAFPEFVYEICLFLDSFCHWFIYFWFFFIFIALIRPHLFTLHVRYMHDNPICRTPCLVPCIRKSWLVWSVASSGLLFCVPVCLKQNVNDIAQIFHVLFVLSIFFVFAYTRLVCDYVLFTCQCHCRCRISLCSRVVFCT